MSHLKKQHSEQAGSAKIERDTCINRCFQENKIFAIPIPGDGHCLPYSVSSSLRAAKEKGFFTDEDMGEVSF